MISYSQNFEDVLLWRALQDVKKGFYVDVGAADPVQDSVTKWFYDQGWSGINLEPNPEDYQALVAGRPRDINLQLAVGPQTGKVQFFLNQIKGWSTLQEEVAKQAETLGGSFKKIEADCMPLREILRQHAPKEIHFMKIDVEGYEEEVLASGDFQAWRPWIVVVEYADLRGKFGNINTAFSTLKANGYKEAFFDGLNLFLVAQEKENLCKTLKTPANTFDNYKLFRESDLERQRVELTTMVVEARKQCENLEGQRVELTTMVVEARKQCENLEGQRVELTAMVVEAQKDLRESEKRKYELYLEQNNLSGQIKRLVVLCRQIRLVLLIANPFVFFACRPLFHSIKKINYGNQKKFPTKIKKIGVDLMPLLPGGLNGGAKVFILELIQQIAKKADKIEILLFLPDAKDYNNLFFKHKNIKLISIGKDLSLPARLLGKAEPSLDIWFSDLVAYNKVNEVNLLYCPFGAVLFNVPGVPVVSTFYDSQFQDYPRFFSKSELEERCGNHRRMLARADGIATISDFGRESILARKEFPSDRIRTIYLHLAGRASLGGLTSNLPEGLKSKKYLLYPANFWPHKNHRALLVAFGLACRNGLSDDIILALTGAEDIHKKKLEEASEKMGLASRVRFLGFLPDEELANVLREALALFFPSLYEGFGIPVVEAQAAGVPVGCSRAASLPEVAGEGALFFNPKKPMEMAEAMIRIATDLSLREELVLKGRANAQRFSDPEAMAQTYLDFFREIASQPRIKVTMSGVFADRWIGRKLEITNYHSLAVVVVMAVIRPEWMKHKGRLWWGAKKHSWIPRLWRTVRQGKELEFSIRLKPGQSVNLKFAPCENDETARKMGDKRRLSCLMLRCVVFGDGLQHDLLEQSTS